MTFFFQDFVSGLFFHWTCFSDFFAEEGLLFWTASYAERLDPAAV